VEHARHPQRTTDDGQCVVGPAHGLAAPIREVIRVSCHVDGVANAAVQEHEGAPGRRDTHGGKETIEQEDREVQDVSPFFRVTHDSSFESVHGLTA
jgi:hypothetical protein